MPAAAEIARQTVSAANYSITPDRLPPQIHAKMAARRDNNSCNIKYLVAGWGGRIRTSAWRNQNPLPYRLATPQHLPSPHRPAAI
jgi:hypothetical protein